jgi:hypothetical protein
MFTGADEDLWTDERMERVIKAAVQNKVALEINSMTEFPASGLSRKPETWAPSFHSEPTGELQKSLGTSTTASRWQLDASFPPTLSTRRVSVTVLGRTDEGLTPVGFAVSHRHPSWVATLSRRFRVHRYPRKRDSIQSAIHRLPNRRVGLLTGSGEPVSLHASHG